MTMILSEFESASARDVCVNGIESVKGDLAWTLELGIKLTLGPAAAMLLLPSPSCCVNPDEASVSPSPTVIETGIDNAPGGSATPDPARLPVVSRRT